MLAEGRGAGPIPRRRGARAGGAWRAVEYGSIEHGKRLAIAAKQDRRSRGRARRDGLSADAVQPPKADRDGAPRAESVQRRGGPGGGLQRLGADAA